MENSRQQKFTVSSYEINPNGNARLTALANYFQELAYSHARVLGVGYRALLEKETAWILSRKRIKVFRYPKWDEVLTVETWPRGVDKIYALRDFKIFDEAGEIIAIAASYWLQADINTHRPLRIGKDFLDIVTRTDAVFDTEVKRVRLPKDVKPQAIRKIVYSDLDIVGHTNNVKYIELCTDLIPSEHILKKGVSDFEITFIGESMVGDEIELSCSDCNNEEIFIGGYNKTKDKEAFVAKLNLGGVKLD